MLLENFPPQWFKDSTNLTNFLGVGDGQLTVGMTVITNVHDAMFLATATGSDLDNVGAKVGLLRFLGEEDNIYRARMLAIMGSSQNIASNEELQFYLTAALGGQVFVLDDQLFPGNMVVYLADPTTQVTPTYIKATIDLVRPAGIGYRVLAVLALLRGQSSMVAGTAYINRRVGFIVGPTTGTPSAARTVGFSNTVRLV